jgi:glycosyltransferase involved in cell wall biosynthesis
MEPTVPAPGLRVAFVTGNYDYHVDGVSLTTNRQVAYLVQRGVPVRVYSPVGKRAEIVHAGPLVPVPSVGIPSTPYRLGLGLPRAAREDLSAFRPTLVHLTTPDLLGVATWEWARRRRIPVVTTYHTHFASYARYYGLGFLEPALWWIQKWFYPKCDAVYTASGSMADELRRHGVNANFVPAPFGVDQANFSPTFRSEDWRAKHGFKPDDVVLAFVGRLVWEKGLVVLAETSHALTAAGVPHKVLVVGQGPAEAGLRAKLPDAVYAGYLGGKELGTAFASSDIFLFPSASETFGCVTVEALASGLPAVVADATGSRDIVRNDVEGLVCPTGDVPAFAAAVTRLVREPDTRRRLASAGITRAAEFRWDAVLALMLENFRRAANKIPT